MSDLGLGWSPSCQFIDYNIDVPKDVHYQLKHSLYLLLSQQCPAITRKQPIRARVLL